jgi:hypothetical protein
MSCELRFHGESYGWEAQFFERDELWFSRSGFVTRALAVQFAEEERKAFATGNPLDASSRQDQMSD